MKAVIHVVLGSVLIVTSALAAAAQTAASTTDTPANKQAEVTFQFDRPGLPVPRFTLKIREDGTGNYQADQGEIAATPSSWRR